MAEPIFSLKNVSYKYPSGIMALDGLNIELPKGKRIALLGGNGAGKSTMLFMLNGILKPTEGLVAYNGTPYQYNRKALRDVRARVGFLFQDSDNQLLAPTVYEEISFGLSNLYMDGNSKITNSLRNRVREKVQSVMEELTGK
ncbi:MAG: ATP-binding cassette domain-containing protein [Cytophagales bacterium]|nr:ATP-binding cassette domain-containing protein [Cytophagales bacterium]